MANVLVINMGLKSIRAIIFDGNGHKLGSAAEPIRTIINDYKVEQNPNEWWKMGLSVMGRALRDAFKCHIDYITITTSASCLVSIDENGNPLCNAFMVSDKRAEKETKYIKELNEFKKVKEATGMDMSSSLMLPKILWLKNNERKLFKKAKYFLSPNDFLIYKLTGEVVTDTMNATKYHYNIETENYPKDLLDSIEIDLGTLPKVVNTGEIVGGIRKDIAEQTGINYDAKVVITSYDAICSFVGSGASKVGEASDVSGTVTVFRAITNNKSLPNNKIYNSYFAQGGYNIVGGSNNMGGGLIEWVKQCYYEKEEYPYEVMEKDASESDIGAKGLIFLPYLLGERMPLWNDDARGAFFGLERLHTRKDMTRAVFESTGFISRSMGDAITEATGQEITSVRLSGGMARINLISQIKADILGKEVYVLSEFETTSSGAAIMALCGQNEFTTMSDAIEKFSNIRMIINPNRELHKKYDCIYELFKETYKNLEPLYTKRMKLVNEVLNTKSVRIENL